MKIDHSNGNLMVDSHGNLMVDSHGKLMVDSHGNHIHPVKAQFKGYCCTY